MNLILPSVLGVLLCRSLTPAAASVPDVTKAEVKKLLDAKVSESTIREFIRVHGPMVPLSSEDLVELKKAGASADLLQALVDSSTSRANRYDSVPYLNYPYYYSYSSSPYYSSYYSYPISTPTTTTTTLAFPTILAIIPITKHIPSSTPSLPTPGKAFTMGEAMEVGGTEEDITKERTEWRMREPRNSARRWLERDS